MNLQLKAPSLGAVLQGLRSQKGVSLSTISAATGISRKTLRELENDQRGWMQDHTLQTLATYYELPETFFERFRPPTAFTAAVRLEDGGTPLGARLRALRDAHQLSQNEVTRALGLRRSHLAQIECGIVQQPSPYILGRLAHFYQVDLQELFDLGQYDHRNRAEHTCPIGIDRLSLQDRLIVQELVDSLNGGRVETTYASVPPKRMWGRLKGNEENERTGTV